MAEHSYCNEFAYAYPLFKTHNLNKCEVLSTSIFEIPTRLVQSAGKIRTSIVTSFLAILIKK